MARRQILDALISGRLSAMAYPPFGMVARYLARFSLHLPCALCLAVLMLAPSVAHSSSNSTASIQFNRDIRPILSDTWLPCPTVLVRPTPTPTASVLAR